MLDKLEGKAFQLRIMFTKMNIYNNLPILYFKNMICSSRLTDRWFKEGIKGDGINTPDYTKHLKKTEVAIGSTQLKSLPFEYSSEMLVGVFPITQAYMGSTFLHPF